MKKLIITLAVIALVLAGCDKDDPAHTHDFSGAWKSDSAQHWKECPDDSAEDQRANHTPTDGICTVCEYDNTPTPCNCLTTYGQTAHLGIDEPCNCPATVKPCACTEQIGDVAGIPVHKVAGISVADMNDAVGELNTAYTAGVVGDPNKNAFKQKIAEIKITATGKSWIYGTDEILIINLNSIPDDLDEVLGAIAMNFIQPGSDIDNIIS